VAGFVRDVVAALRGHDLLLYAAGVTFYGAIALVPGLLVAIRLAGVLAGPDRVHALSRSLAEALPDAMGAPSAVPPLVGAGLNLPVVTALLAVLPASLYGEGLRRAFVSLAGAPDPLVGWRGRLLVVPLLVAAPQRCSCRCCTSPRRWRACSATAAGAW
jgi:membrane protein